MSNADTRPWRSQTEFDAEDRLHETAQNSENFVMDEQDSIVFGRFPKAKFSKLFRLQ